MAALPALDQILLLARRFVHYWHMHQTKLQLPAQEAEDWQPHQQMGGLNAWHGSKEVDNAQPTPDEQIRIRMPE